MKTRLMIASFALAGTIAGGTPVLAQQAASPLSAKPSAYNEVVRELRGGALTASQVSGLDKAEFVLVIDLRQLADPAQRNQLQSVLGKAGTNPVAVRDAVQNNKLLMKRIEDRGVDAARIVAVTGEEGGTVTLYLGSKAA